MAKKGTVIVTGSSRGMYVHELLTKHDTYLFSVAKLLSAAWQMMTSP